ncbi:MAG: polysaccharide deacetylase family protein, partial [Candidatus Marinimicrobia bacterium]|nr:polysaccharide deacetylase family protein [Candidatus Neomarinimicrobiota bacterium]
MNKKTILLTIDTEFYFSLEEIFGINGENGIEDILNIFDEHNVKATFFIDYLSIGKWGEKPFIKLTKLLKKSGHDIQLHAHSDSFGGKPYFWQLSYDKQKFVIEKAIHYFEKFNSETPKFFRAGSYSANNDTLEILKEKGFTADLSFQYKQKRCKIIVEKFQFVNKVGLIDDLLEIPTGVYKYYYPFPRYNSINLEWCSLSELKEICKQFEKSNADHFVLMLHSFSLLKRKDRSRFSRSSVNKKRLEKFLRFATQNGFRFQTVTEYY